MLAPAGAKLLRSAVWAAYEALARLGAIYLTWGVERPAVYVRAGLGTGDLTPGKSDVDLAVVVPADGSSSARAWRRWERLERRLPAICRLFDVPRIYDEDELADVVGASAMTYGLCDAGEDRGALLGESTVGKRRVLFRPGLYGATSDWRAVTGPDRLPAEPERGPQEQLIAGWLELVYWWRWAFAACADPRRQATPRLCAKLVAEPMRIWLWLWRGERLATRGDVLRRALEVVPEEGEAIRRALAPDPGRGLPALREVMPALIRVSARIAGLLADDAASAGSTDVRLVEQPAAGSLPLCDWRALAAPSLPDEAFTLRVGDPADPSTLGELARGQKGALFPALPAAGLLVLPAATFERSRARAVKAELTDPVCFALASASTVASFPELHGWSAEDTARRAVAEHRAWLRTGRGPGPVWLLLSAARAALFLESVRDGDAELATTLAGAASRLAARFPGTAVEDAVRSARADAVRELVLRLPSYAAL